MSVADLLAALPRKVKVGSLTYAIEVIEGLKDETGDQWGIWVGDKQTIRIEQNQPSGQWAADTVIHEILHAIWAERGLGKRPCEEQVVQAMGAGITALLQDNPKLNSWIRKAIRK
jgi:hypothetical protein